jgi:hypothetical protein
MSEKLILLARQRLPQYASNLFAGNAWYWKPPLRFDFVRSEVNVVPEELQKEYVTRLLDKFVLPSGRLLITEYRSSQDDFSGKWIDECLEEWGFQVAYCKSGFDAGKELARVAVVHSLRRRRECHECKINSPSIFARRRFMNKFRRI